MNREAKGLPTRIMLVAALAVVITSVTLASLLVVRSHLQRQVLDDFSSDLTHSVQILRSTDAERLAALRRENALLADLPSLKALMTTADAATIADGAVRFWKVSDNDLFALADTGGNLVAAYTRGEPASDALKAELKDLLQADGRRFLVAEGRLFEYSVQPLFFGADKTGTLLGYVISGYAFNSTLVRQIGQSSGAEVAFLTRTGVVTSTLPPLSWKGSESSSHRLVSPAGAPFTIELGRQRYLISAKDLSSSSSEPLYLVVMKSFAHAEATGHELNRLLVIVCACALCAGTAFMIAISGVITGPLELLTSSVRAYGRHAGTSIMPIGGPREVRELSDAFIAMSNQIREKSHKLLESERLATIGRMASSVSHDLRHQLAAVYANAEFLVSSSHSENERAELFNEIRLAVHETTDLLDSLLIFSRTNSAAPRTPEVLAHILDKALSLMRSHPDAQGVEISMEPGEAHKTMVVADRRQVERAVFNLLLNACQAARANAEYPRVSARIELSDAMLKLHIVDNGGGVAPNIRDSLFEPFVSEGKQNGTGLGLTMAHAVAREHGGSVELLQSRPGETVFVLSLGRALLNNEGADEASMVEFSR